MSPMMPREEAPLRMLAELLFKSEDKKNTAFCPQSFCAQENYFGGGASRITVATGYRREVPSVAEAPERA